MQGWTKEAAEAAVCVKKQRGGETIFIPTGVSHQVVTIRPCLKISFDFVESSRLLVSYAHVNRAISHVCQKLPGFATADYMALLTKGLKVLERHGAGVRLSSQFRS